MGPGMEAQGEGTCGAERGREPEAPAHGAPQPRRLRVTTGRRLFFAFAALVCAFGAVLAFTTTRLRGLEATLDGMRLHEERIRLALELQSALRDAVAHQAQIVSGEEVRLPDYLEARQRAIDLEAQLPLLAGDVDEAAWAGEVGRASEELRQVLDRRIDEARVSGDRGVPSGERGHALIMFIEDRLDRLCTREHAAAVAKRALVSEVERSTLRWILAFVAGAPLFAAAIGWYIHRSVARPVARLGEGAARLARGELGTRIAMESPDEFGALAAQFNAMSASLQAHQEKLVQSEKLAGIGRLAAGFAHELGNPLSVILGYVMLHGRRAEGRLARDLAAVEQEALRCREIVQDLLELARPDHIRVAAPVDLHALCDEVVGAVAAAGHLPRVAVAGEGVAHGSRAKLRQVLVNLVRNAAEAAGAAGEVDVRVRADGGFAIVEVSDTGPGIPAEARARLFEPFFTTKPTGTGLGLAVSRAIARGHGGDLTLTDRRGGGACFTLSVPLSGSTPWQTASSSSTTVPA
jgi:two-component system, NtrC family, sensor kinase